jgi:hypothetical protein
LARIEEWHPATFTGVTVNHHVGIFAHHSMLHEAGCRDGRFLLAAS